jgi:hypothetical protein
LLTTDSWTVLCIRYVVCIMFMWTLLLATWCERCFENILQNERMPNAEHIPSLDFPSLTLLIYSHYSLLISVLFFFDVER